MYKQKFSYSYLFCHLLVLEKKGIRTAVTTSSWSCCEGYAERTLQLMRCTVAPVGVAAACLQHTLTTTEMCTVFI